MEIITSGCSFTAGDELVELIPNYLESGPDPKLIAQHQKVLGNLWNKDRDRYREILELQKQKAWPAKLQKLNPYFEVQNIAQGGISNEEICWRVIKQISRNFRKPNLVIIMLTAPVRFGHAIHTEPTEYNFRSYLPTSPSWLTNLIAEPDGYDNLWRTLNTISGTKKLLEARNIPYIIVDSGMAAFAVDQKKKREKEIYSLLDVKLNFGDLMIEHGNLHVRLPGSHPTEQMHEIFAKEVYECMMSYI